MESLKNAKCVLESPCKVLEVFVQKRVRTLLKEKSQSSVSFVIYNFAKMEAKKKLHLTSVLLAVFLITEGLYSRIIMP